MSHVVAIKTKVRDLQAVKAACHRLGWTFKEDQKTYQWWGRWVNDYHKEDAAYHQGIKPEDYGKCSHAIGVPDCNYEIGLVHTNTAFPHQAPEYSLIFDFMDHKLKEAVGGTGCDKFLQMYAVEKAKLEAKRKGYACSEQTQADGSIKLRISAY